MWQAKSLVDWLILFVKQKHRRTKGVGVTYFRVNKNPETHRRNNTFNSPLIESQQKLSDVIKSWGAYYALVHPSHIPHLILNDVRIGRRPPSWNMTESGFSQFRSLRGPRPTWEFTDWLTESKVIAAAPCIPANCFLLLPKLVNSRHNLPHGLNGEINKS